MKRALFLVCLAALLMPAAARAADAGIGASFKGPLGLQLYSLRDSFSKDVPGTLKQVYDFGFRTVELAGTYGKSPEEFAAMLKAAGLKAVAGHFSYETFRDHPETIAQEAKALGLEWAGTAWVPHSGPVTETWARETAKVFNHAGEVLAQHGIKFFYHNHGYEFVPLAQGTVFDVLVQETQPGRVYFEMDVMWTVFPGQDPARLLEKYPGRWGLMHVKDLKKGVPTGSLAGSTDVHNDVVVGTGQTDWVALLRAAQKVGVKHYFIEDESPSVREQIPQSLKFLETVKF
ncbi:MAG TPA: sugar phosphate isomerase/epimerase [Verrucomicrobiota bacterium]|nr:sugar phosphate isomerase/epimerase [Verrucomicrobiota bacterium]HNT14377.1 sugar phosphate isomerase/epimerase [Verrucomicrobiota bacterium]